MEREKLKGKWPLVVCVVLFLVALGVNLLLEEKPGITDSPVMTGNVIITEIMSNNRTYPDASGRPLDYIEVSNLSGAAVDISNYKLSDDEKTIGYTFPRGTVLQPYGSIVCWCDDQGGEAYASFGIARDGGETVYLYNSANVVIDQVEVPALGQNRPYLRGADGSWTSTGLASPGFANTDQGNAQWLESIGYRMPAVVLSEVQTTARYTWLDENQTVCDWVELYNAGSETVVLDGAYLSDDPADPLKWQIPSLTIAPNGYAVIRCGGENPGDAGFRLSADGGRVTLTSAYGSPVTVLDYPAMERDTTWALGKDGSYAVAAKPTPGFENNDDGYMGWLRSVGIPASSVVISEIQTANRSGILDNQGKLCDWVELYNAGTEPVVLDGGFLSDDSADPFKWQIQTLTIAPGEYAVIPCTGRRGDPAEASFGLPQSGGTVLLSGPVGNLMARETCPAMAEDRSWQRMDDGTYTETNLISPGFENSEAGYEQFRDSQSVLGALAVWEVMPSNARYMIQRDGEYYDWVELKNVSDATIDLSDYALSDSSSDYLLFSLPQQELKPGETVVIICSGNPELSGGYIHAPFTLNRDECWIYVTHKEQGVSDYVRVSGVPLMGSAGRMEGDNKIVYFSTPTPNEENKGGMAEMTAAPFVETPDGVYNDVTGVSVVLSGEGQIYYTLDGSAPTTNSYLYQGPIELTETRVVRARSYSEGKIPSPVVTASYIINENHTLPVISIAASPIEVFGENGIYTKFERNMEIPCNITLFEGDGGFQIDCGLKLYGHSGLMKEKKSFKVNFRRRYGESELNYPVFGEDGPFLYDSLCIRSGQDYPQAIFRDELFTKLASQMGDNVLIQRHKFCILYVNGEYFGIYSMKEAFNELYYAQNRDVRKESVEIVQAPVEYTSEMHEFFRFLESNDMSLDENYEYACSVFNMDSVIDWLIIEGYCTNGDVQQNLRYFRSTDNGNRFEMAYYDLDWAFYSHLPFTDVLSSENDAWQHLMLTQNLMEHPTFRQTFLERLSYHMQHTLSNENVLAEIEYFYELLSPEVPRERSKWGSNYDQWIWDINRLRKFINEWDHLGDIVDRLTRYIGLTQEEIDTYFWRWK